MLESGFYEPKNGDRKYSVENLNEILDGIVSDGIIPNISDEFEVTSNGLNVVIGTGRALFDHIWIKNTEPIEMALNASTSKRYDAVILEINKSEDVRETRIFVLEGDESSIPVKPLLQSDANIIQHALAYCLVNGNSVAIEDARVFAEGLLGAKEDPNEQPSISQSYFTGLWPCGNPIVNFTSEYGIRNECKFDGGLLFLLRNTQKIYYVDKNCVVKCISVSGGDYLCPICQFGNGVLFNHTTAGYVRYWLFDDNGMLYSPSNDTITVLPSGSTNYTLHAAHWDAKNNRAVWMYTYTQGSTYYMGLNAILYPSATIMLDRDIATELSTPYTSGAITDDWALMTLINKRSGNNALDLYPYLISTKDGTVSNLSPITPEMDGYANFRPETFWSDHYQKFIIVFSIPNSSGYNRIYYYFIDPKTRNVTSGFSIDSYSYGYSIGNFLYDDATQTIWYACQKNTSGTYTYRLMKWIPGVSPALIQLPIAFQSLFYNRYTFKYIHHSLIPINTTDTDYPRLLYDAKNGDILIPYTPRPIENANLIIGEDVAILSGYHETTHKTRPIYSYNLNKRFVPGGASIDV